MPRPGIIRTVLMTLAVPRTRLRLPVPAARRRARPLAWRRRMESGDMMNVFAANDLEAADLLPWPGTTTARRRR